MKINSILLCLFVLGIVYYLSKFKEGHAKLIENGNCEIKKGEKCVKCNIGYQLNDDGAACELRPIHYCKVQKGIKCSVCQQGYAKSEDSMQCELRKIPHCADQPKYPGNICKSCNKRYVLKGNKCWALGINNCKTQEDLVCKECKRGYTLRNNECNETKIPFCEKQEDGRCINCINPYALKDNKCNLISRIEYCKHQLGSICKVCEEKYTLRDNTCIPSKKGQLDNCEKTVNNKCVKCNKYFNLSNEKCERIGIVKNCKTQKGYICLNCAKGYTLRGNMCLSGNIQALKKRPLKKALHERCPPIPECQPGCVKGQGKCVAGMCVCNNGFAGNQCERKLNPRCPMPDPGPIREWKLLDNKGGHLEKKNFHIYNNTETSSIPILRTIKESLNKVVGLMGPDPGDCRNSPQACPAPGAMSTDEIKRWGQRLKEVREHVRCTPDKCPMGEENDDKVIKVKGGGQKLLSVKGRKKEGFSLPDSLGASVPKYLNPKQALGPDRTSNMFNFL